MGTEPLQTKVSLNEISTCARGLVSAGRASLVNVGGVPNNAVQLLGDEPAHAGIVASIVGFSSQFLARRNQCPSDRWERTRHFRVQPVVPMGVDGASAELATPFRQRRVHCAQAVVHVLSPDATPLPVEPTAQSHPPLPAKSRSSFRVSANTSSKSSPFSTASVCLMP